MDSLHYTASFIPSLISGRIVSVKALYTYFMSLGRARKSCFEIVIVNIFSPVLAVYIPESIHYQYPALLFSRDVSEWSESF